MQSGKQAVTQLTSIRAKVGQQQEKVVGLLNGIKGEMEAVKPDFLKQLMANPSLPLDSLPTAARNRPEVKALLNTLSQEKTALSQVTKVTDLINTQQQKATEIITQVKDNFSTAASAFDPAHLSGLLDDPTALTQKIPPSMRDLPEVQSALANLGSRAGMLGQVTNIKSTIQTQTAAAGNLLKQVQGRGGAPSFMSVMVQDPNILFKTTDPKFKNNPEIQQVVTLLNAKADAEEEQKRETQALEEAKEREEAAEKKKKQLIAENKV